jgi:hypothetical protein
MAAAAAPPPPLADGALVTCVAAGGRPMHGRPAARPAADALPTPLQRVRRRRRVPRRARGRHGPSPTPDRRRGACCGGRHRARGCGARRVRAPWARGGQDAGGGGGVSVGRRTVVARGGRAVGADAGHRPSSSSGALAGTHTGAAGAAAAADAARLALFARPRIRPSSAAPSTLVLPPPGRGRSRGVRRLARPRRRARGVVARGLRRGGRPARAVGDRWLCRRVKRGRDGVPGL